MLSSEFPESRSLLAMRLCCVCAQPASSTCSRCKQRRYCGDRRCQISDWKAGHKASCRRRPSGATASPPLPSSTAVQQLSAGGSHTTDYAWPGGWTVRARRAPIISRDELSMSEYSEGAWKRELNLTLFMVRASDPKREAERDRERQRETERRRDRERQRERHRETERQRDR